MKMKKKIIVPTDLTGAANQAVRQAAVIARKAQATLVLLHILDSKSPSAEEIERKLNLQATELWEQSGLACEVLLRPGSVLEEIPVLTREHDWDLMVIGTHGIKGIRQMLTGPDILKLVAKISIPVLVVQENTPLIEDFKRIILPVSSHESFLPALDALLFFASLYNVEIHLYSIYKAGFEWPKQLLLNIDEAIKLFETKGVNYKRIKEDQTSYSMGYAKQTLKYAESVHADYLCIMSVPSKDYYYFAQTDKEKLLLNEFNIPVLCTGGGY
jgi:nucleotide-binding universal stress UspA family protein